MGEVRLTLAGSSLCRLGLGLGLGLSLGLSPVAAADNASGASSPGVERDRRRPRFGWGQ